MDAKSKLQVVSEVAENVVARGAKKAPNVPCLVVMIYGQSLRASSSACTNSTSPSLALVESVILLPRDAVRLEDPSRMCLRFDLLLAISMMCRTAWPWIWSRTFRVRLTILTPLTCPCHCSTSAQWSSPSCGSPDCYNSSVSTSHLTGTQTGTAYDPLLSRADLRMVEARLLVQRSSLFHLTTVALTRTTGLPYVSHSPPDSMLPNPLRTGRSCPHQVRTDHCGTLRPWAQAAQPPRSDRT